MLLSAIRRLPIALCVAAAAVCATAPAHAQDSGVSTPASHAVIMDYETGLVLFSKNADEPMPPASMSKLMTALMVMERIKEGSLSLEDQFIVSEDAWRRGGFASGSSTMCLEPGEQVSVADLLRGVIVLSGNDASITLAEGLSGSEAAFAEDMNHRAEELGLSSATFLNSTGWPDEGHEISARDLATIARVIIQEHPDLYPIYAEREFGFCTEAPSNRFNRNPALGLFEGADGLKTGHTSRSGYGLVASAVQNGDRRIVVFNGLDSASERAREASRLLGASFRLFRTATVFEAGTIVGEAPVALGVSPRVSLRIEEDVQAGYTRRAARDARAEIVLSEGLIAPISAGEPVGELVFTVPGAEPVRRTVYAVEDVAKAGLIDRAVSGLVGAIRAGSES